MLYAIQVGNDGPVKLGVTTRDPKTRLRALQTSHHSKLHLRATWPGDAADERTIHRRFADIRLHGEWFTWTPDLCAFVNACRAGVAPAFSNDAPTICHGVDRASTPDLCALGSATVIPVAPVRSAEECVGALCELVPRLTVQQLLAWLTLVEFAGPDWEARVDLAMIADRALGHRDSRAAADLLLGLYGVDLSDPLRRVPARPGGRLICGVMAELPPDLRGQPTTAVCAHTGQVTRAYTLLDGLVANGRASLTLTSRHIASLGPEGLPEAFAARETFHERHAWATEQLAAAQQRVDAGRTHAVASLRGRE